VLDDREPLSGGRSVEQSLAQREHAVAERVRERDDPICEAFELRPEPGIGAARRESDAEQRVAVRRLVSIGPWCSPEYQTSTNGTAAVRRPGLDPVLRRPEVDEKLALAGGQDAVTLIGDMPLAVPHGRDHVGELRVGRADGNAPPADRRCVLESLQTMLDHGGTPRPILPRSSFGRRYASLCHISFTGARDHPPVPAAWERDRPCDKSCSSAPATSFAA
jgi:hypothetical protein